MRAADTNVLVRLVVRDDERQVKLAEAFVERGAWISHLVLAETIGVLDAVYGLDAKAIMTAIEMLLNHAELTVQDAGVMVLEIARRAGHLPLGTFDRALSKLDGAERL